jgi:hypothetical protein
MEIKLIELRDRGTFIPMLAIKPVPRSEEERYLLARAGYGRSPDDQGEYVLLARLEGGPLRYDPYDWEPPVRTFREAHLWLQDHWDEIASGAVLDVEFIRGETTAPKISERDTFPRPDF